MGRSRKNKAKVNKITHKNLADFSQKFNKTRTNKVLKNVATKGKFRNLVLKADHVQNKKRVFKNKIDVDTKITDQKSSGRCWLFAFLNVMRLKMIEKYKLDKFEFSQNYLSFYDKLEKANFYLNYIAQHKSVPLTDTKLIHVLDNLMNDGGQWNMFVNLIEKYGIVPKSSMGDHHHSENSEDLNTFYNNFLRKAAKKIRNSSGGRENMAKIINELLAECYKMLVIFLGEPPQKITWEYYKQGKSNNSKKKYSKLETVSPVEFYKKHVPYDATEQICLINYPCKHAPYYKMYNVELAANVLGEKEMQQNFINVPIDVMINATKSAIDAKEAVWVGSDIDKYISSKDGILDKKAFNYIDVFGFETYMEKCDSMDFRQSAPNHAIIIRGYNTKDGKVDSFLVENSWGKDSGYEGNYTMSVDWFKDYVYEIVIDKKHVSNKERAVLKKKPILLPYWSPFGNLL